jgi:hypothetical protein
MQQRLSQKQKTYRERARQCRNFAQLGPEHMKESFLRLAEAYEEFDEEAEDRPRGKVR